VTSYQVATGKPKVSQGFPASLDKAGLSGPCTLAFNFNVRYRLWPTEKECSQSYIDVIIGIRLIETPAAENQ